MDLDTTEINLNPHIDYVNWEGCHELWFAQLIRDNNIECSDEFQWSNPKVKEICKATWIKKSSTDETVKLIEDYFYSLYPNLKVQ